VRTRKGELRYRIFKLVAVRYVRKTTKLPRGILEFLETSAERLCAVRQAAIAPPLTGWGIHRINEAGDEALRSHRKITWE